MNQFVFIAVNYNGSDFSLQYIKSVNELYKEASDDIQIIIVDNKSSMEDYQKLEQGCIGTGNVKLIRSEENLGYFKGLNRGMAEVDKNPDTLLIIGNNDLTFEPDFLINLKKIKYTPEVFAIAPNIITREGRQQNPLVVERVSSKEKLKASLYYSNYYVGQVFHILNQLLKRVKKTKKVMTNQYPQMKIKLGIGACYILTPNFNRAFDKLDDSVFMWGEEAVFAHQVESKGGIILYDPTILIHHHESASVVSIQSKKKYYMVKESYQIYKKYL